MPSRHADWMAQARRDLEHARHSTDSGDYEWACFAAHQSAEKAAKALCMKLGADAWGHSVKAVLSGLPVEVTVPPNLIEKAMELDKHYIPPRYPNSHPEGAPFEYYSEGDALEAVEYGEAIISFCEDHVSG